jgi:hypothetical protein
VDQAKGILMHALGCSAEDALGRMLDVSQRSNIRTTEVARRIVAAHDSQGKRADRARRAGRDQLSELADLAAARRRRE